MKKKPVIKKYLSYLFPITIHREYNTHSKVLEVSWINGKLVLDSKHTNYSFGCLQRVLRMGLLHIGKEPLLFMKDILVLGVAGGCIIDTLVNEFKVTAKITGVELDEKIIELSNTYFGLSHYPNLDILHHEAFEFVLKTQKKYDLIVIDIFKDTHMPSFLFEKFFQFRLGQIVNRNGFVIFNTMVLNDTDRARNEMYIKELDLSTFSYKILSKVEDFNEVIVLNRL